MILPGVLADALCDVLAREERSLAEAGASHGLDALTETELQGRIAEGLASFFHVVREAHYPSSRDARRSHRRRCDFVLAPLDVPESSTWLELKVAHQYRPGLARNPRYRTQWQSGIVEDLRKMASDADVRDPMFALVAFTESEARVTADLETFEQWLVASGVEVGFRKVRSLPIVDRRGHATCTVAVWPVLGAKERIR